MSTDHGGVIMLIFQSDFAESHINNLEVIDGVSQSFTYDETHTKVLSFFLAATSQSAVHFLSKIQVSRHLIY